MRRSNITELKPKTPGHGEGNPYWHAYMTPVYAGRGVQPERVEMVVIKSDGNSVEGWDRQGRYIQVRNVRVIDTHMREVAS